MLELPARELAWITRVVGVSGVVTKGRSQLLRVQVEHISGEGGAVVRIAIDQAMPIEGAASEKWAVTLGGTDVDLLHDPPHWRNLTPGDFDLVRMERQCSVALAAVGMTPDELVPCLRPPTDMDRYALTACVSTGLAMV